MNKHLALAVVLAALLSGCSGTESAKTVRSDDGPTAASSDPAVQTPSESSDDDSDDAAPVEPTTSPLLQTQGDIEIPDGDPGALSVVVIGAPDRASGTVPVVIRNRTDAALSNLEVTGTARDGDGALAGSGASQGFAPETIQPGEWAVGYVYMDARFTPDTEFDLTATGQEPDDFLSAVDLEVVEVSLARGQFGDQLVGIVENPTAAEVTGPISVLAGCFADDGTLVGTPSGYADSDPLAAGGTSSFSIDLFDDPCENWAIGASGYDY